ncbi:hypothetical protein ACFOU2_23485, partial [Bacillus songklensis]
NVALIWFVFSSTHFNQINLRYYEQGASFVHDNLSGANQIQSLFEWGEDGVPALTEQDESTITSNLFLLGPNVRHKQVIFCFIYKFRQRFAIVAKEILERNNIPYKEEVFEKYRRNQMFLDDLSCCEVKCEC